MTSGKHRKRLARQRAARTGEPYTTALRSISIRKEGLVPSSPSSSSAVIASCSFCGKDNTLLEKLIAGPGVYICNECVGLCNDILTTTMTAEEAASARAAFENRAAPEILEILPAIARNADSVEADLQRLVSRLRSAETTWDEIALRLGLSVEAAQDRFDRS